jgi:hypothetical protein
MTTLSAPTFGDVEKTSSLREVLDAASARPTSIIAAQPVKSVADYRPPAKVITPAEIVDASYKKIADEISATNSAIKSKQARIDELMEGISRMGRDILELGVELGELQRHKNTLGISLSVAEWNIAPRGLPTAN